MSGPVLTRTEPRAAEWKKIPDGMRALWKACLPEHDGGDVARSLAINFIGVTTVAEQDGLRDALDRLARRTPCRAFVLLFDDAAPVGTAQLTATTRSHGNVRDIVLEEITIRLPEAALGQIPGLVLVHRAGEPLVEREPHADVGDVVLRQERLDIEVELGLDFVEHGLPAQLMHGIFEHLSEQIESDRRNVSALFGSEQVSGAA